MIARGGGHAHSGCLIYNGGNWPTEYDDKLLTLNFHGRRVNVERIEPDGAGNVARHEPDILKSADPWFRGIDLSTGPDGSVFILDWSDTGECHDSTGIHRSSGRIYQGLLRDTGICDHPSTCTRCRMRSWFEHASPSEHSTGERINGSSVRLVRSC